MDRIKADAAEQAARRSAYTLDGDIGARHLINRHGEALAEVPAEGFGAFLDIDTPQALEAARRG
jgi:molybdenum cofactor cytidylyltransferase